MLFDPNNKVVHLCAEGMQHEGNGDNAGALQCYEEAWALAADDFEKFTAAHYIARQQTTVADKLAWDQKALDHALEIDDEAVKQAFPSLYLNIARCYEDMGEADRAEKMYRAAQGYAHLLPADGYGNMIRAGIAKGLERISGNIT